MYKKIINSFFNISTFIGLFLAIVLYKPIDIMNLINHSVTNKDFVFSFGVLLLLWIIFELMFKKEYLYILFLFFMSIPIQDWIVSRGYIQVKILGLFVSYNLIFLTIFLIKLMAEKKLKFKRIKPLYMVLFFGYSFLSIVSILNSKNNLVAINGVVYGVFLPIVFIAIILNLLNKKKNVECIYKILNFSFLFMNLFSLFVSSTSFLIPDFTGRVVGAFANSNDVAFIQIMSISISLYFILYKEKKRYYFHIIISVIVAFSTGSRSIIVLLGIFVLILGKRYLRNRKIFTVVNATFIILIIAISLFDDFLINNLSIFQRFYERGLHSKRFIAWKDTMDYIKKYNLYFWGIGIGNYNYNHVSILVHAHNSFLHFATIIGFLGSIIFHFLLVLRIKFITLITKNDLYINTPHIIILTMLLFFNINAFVPISHNIYSNVFDIHIRSIYLWLFLGLSYFIDNTKKYNKI